MDKILNHPIWTTHALLLARVMLGGYFVYAGITKVTNGIDGTAGYIASMGLPVPLLLAWIAVVIEIACGACIILGIYFKEATLVLAAFIAILTLIFHGPNLWAEQPMQQTSFLKNISIIAGLLFMAAHGAGNTWKLKLKK